MKFQKKPVVIYLHRYPIEYESIQYAGMRDLFNELLKKYRVIYFSIGGVFPVNPKVRKGIEIMNLPFKVNTSNGKDKWVKTGLYYLFLPSILLKLKKLNPDFIISKEYFPFIPSLIGKLGKPTIVDISDWWWSILFGKNKWGKKVAQFMEKIEVKHWNKLNIIAIAHSNAEGKMVESKGMSKNKIKVINAPQYKEVYSPCKADKERRKIAGKNDWVVSMHGIIHPSKGYEQILTWWKSLVKIHPNWKLLIIGGQSGEAICKKQIAELNLTKNIIMTGWLSSQELVNKYLNASDCLLVTRRNTPENQGVIPSSLYHSLAVGKPTIATGLPGMSEIIEHKKSGLLFEPDNYGSFKECLEYIYNNKKQAVQIGKQGIKRADECFDPKQAAKKWVAVIDDALKK